MQKVKLPALRAMLADLPPGDGCIEWPYARIKTGYGQVLADNGKVRPVHRVAYEIAVGPIPDGMDICHRCDNPPCFRPSHLFPGTKKENMQDCVSKGRKSGKATGDTNGMRRYPERVPRGETHGAAKLTDTQVLEIRALRANGWKLKPLAARFGVHFALIGLIANRKIWRHI